ncbi:MAG: gliding motility-associated ABC transporter substrate-binding protein GldG [Bacteroidetes bacterium]|nr:gliding motility-associated ABC transporter substrate-binding protein GldG [Bacteroidota bacterium]
MKKNVSDIKNRIFKNKLLSDFIIFLAVLVVLNIIADEFYFRIDLTKEKRYTLAKSTKNLLGKLDDVVYFNIYLDGDLTSDYKRLKEACRDILNEYRQQAGSKIQFEFEDVLSDKELKEKDEILKQLSAKGLEINRSEISDDKEAAEKFIIPGAIVFFKGKEYPLNFLKKKFGNSIEQDINQSIELLEYEIGNILRKCVANNEVKLALINGHGELTDNDIADIGNELSNFYTLSRFNLNLKDTNCLKQVRRTIADSGKITPQTLVKTLIGKIKTFKGIIIAKPVIHFTDLEKFIIDQYVMNGGKVIWLVESLNAEMDSVGKYGSIFTYDYDLNLNDILFRYGVRINPDLVQDMQCHGIPVVSKGGSGKPGFLPWLYYPLFNAGDSTHPIVKNLGSVWGQFASSIDTTSNQNIKKTILLQSSQYSRIAGNPVNVSLEILGIKPNPETFNKPYRSVAVLLEGRFKSLYEHISSVKQEFPFKPEISNNSMIVISDGDLIRNQIKKGNGEIYPLGYDRFASQTFGEAVIFDNKKFMLNCIDYLCDESNLIEVRTKNVELRLLDKARVKTEKTRWQLINMLLPILAIILFSYLNYILRKFKYEKKHIK